MQASKVPFATRATDYAGDCILDTLDEAKGTFAGLSSETITLEGALVAAGITNPYFHSKATEKVKEIRPYMNSFGLTEDEAGAIACYTLEHLDGSNDLPPYKVVNECLACQRSTANIKKARWYLYLLLRGLRKLPRYTLPSDRKLYRGLPTKVFMTLAEAKGHQFYAQGQIVTWWGFTSTTKSFNVAQGFSKSAKGNTVFYIRGKGLWGYDISMFSGYSEHEILLEPETKVKVNRVVLDDPTMIEIHVEFQQPHHLLLEDKIPVSALKWLPKGWEVRRDPATGKKYYASFVDRTTTWALPSYVPLLSDERVAYDDNSKQFYTKKVTEIPAPKTSHSMM